MTTYQNISFFFRYLTFSTSILNNNYNYSFITTMVLIDRNDEQHLSCNPLLACFVMTCPIEPLNQLGGRDVKAKCLITHNLFSRN